MNRRREYRSCYSCDYSEIHGDRKGRTIVCNKSLRIYKPKAGECYPEWCELKGINDERKWRSISRRRKMSDDLIKRSDAIGACAYETIECYEARKAIRALPSADRPQGEWIPCSERLPSEKDYIGDVVIWCTDKSIVGVGWYYESTKSWATIDDTFPPILGEVIAWMPLPKPWKGSDDGADNI